MALFRSPVVRATDANVNALSGAKWYFYTTGTLTPSAVYTTSALSVAHANPVVADAGGLFAPIYLDPSVIYRAILKDALGSTIQDIDPINEAAVGATIASPGVIEIGYKTGGLNTTVYIDNNGSESGLWARRWITGVPTIDGYIRNVLGVYYINATSGGYLRAGGNEMWKWSTMGAGYAAGAGGAVTQATSKTTAVTLNKVTGAITLNGSSVSANSSVSFTFNNSMIQANDRVRYGIRSGAADPSAYLIVDTGTSDGVRSVYVRNLTAGALAEAVSVSFDVYKGDIV